MKKILMIATGGTIASAEGGDGLTPAMTGEELAASVPGIKDKCDLTVLQLKNIITIMTVLLFCMVQTRWLIQPLHCLT